MRDFREFVKNHVDENKMVISRDVQFDENISIGTNIRVQTVQCKMLKT